MHRPGSRRLRFLDGHGVAVSRDVQGQQVGDSVALQLSSRCAVTGFRKTAAAIMDLTKDTIRSNSADEQEAMGVIDPLDAKVATLEGRGKRDHPAGRFRKGAGGHHHRQRDQGERAQGRPGPALRAGAGPEADLRCEHQGRAVDPVCGLDRDEPAQSRSEQDPSDFLQQLQDPGRPQSTGRAGAAEGR